MEVHFILICDEAKLYNESLAGFVSAVFDGLLLVED